MTTSEQADSTGTAPGELDHPTDDRAVRVVWALLRLAIGWQFLWAFLDKAFGLGFATGKDPETNVITFMGDGQAWFNGGSPTKGFLVFATKGPIGEAFADLGGCSIGKGGVPVCTSNTWLDYVFMISLLLIGAGLMLGVMTRLAALGAIAWNAMFFLAQLWPENNPFLDEHLIAILVLVGVILVGAGTTWGLGRRWGDTGIGRRSWWLRG